MSQGLYVEARICGPLNRVWELTQDPALHQRWDLRFSEITYLPRPNLEEPQQFLYTTQIVFGLEIHGTGESVATRTSEEVQISSLRFWSDEKLSLITEGSGYWKYIPGDNSQTVTFLTWYDYRTRFGTLGRMADLVFRPLLGWATAWSFDRLRLWVEDGCPPEMVRTMSLIYALARLTVVFVWLWHGLVPKLLFHDADELRMLHAAGLSLSAMFWISAAEVVAGVAGLAFWRWRGYLALTGIAMAVALIAVALHSPEYLRAAFNPVTLNLCVLVLSVVAWWAWRYSAFAGRCRRSPKKS
ncbi:MAG TPA: DoxX-like family protein [Terracidiphilus sp.]|jgi:DoxX-like family